MASQTLLEAAKFIDDEIVLGVVEDIITINPIYASVPFDGYEGQAIVLNRENVLGDVQGLAVDATITAKAASTYVQTTYSAQKIIGDAEIDKLVQITSAGGGVDQMAQEISSKAKNVGRSMQSGMATGDGTGVNLNSMRSLMDAGQEIIAGVNGAALSFELMDETLDLVVSKDGEVDWIQAPKRTMRSYRALLRALGGTPGDWVVEVDDGRTVLGYEGIPMFKNDYLDIAETQGTETAAGSMYFGNWDDGSRKVGSAMIHPILAPAGISVELLGALEDKDSDLARVKAYVNYCLYNRKSIARLKGLTN